MAGHSAAVFEDSQGQETPVGFRDLPGQWYTANHRKRGTSPRLGEQPTQRDSQATQVVSEGLAPVFVAALPSQEEDIGVQRSQHDGEDVDEEETQIRMSMSEDQEGAVKAERKIFEQAVPLPLTSTASGGRNGADGAAQAVDSDDADSDMSDDMLEQDGSVAGLSSIAASFQQRDQEVEAMKKEFVHVYKPRTSFRISPAVSVHEEEGSGGETEIDDEYNKDAPPIRGDKRNLTRRLVKSASYSKTPVDAETKGIERSLSTPDRISKRNHGPESKTRGGKAKRSRRTSDAALPVELNQDVSSVEESKQLVESDESKHETPPASSDFKCTEESAKDIRVAASKLLSIERARVEEPPPSHVKPRAQIKWPASSHHRKPTPSSRSVTDSELTSSQAEGTPIRVIITGMDATPAIHKQIKSIACVVYETNIEKATHVLVPQNKLKRTVKLLCGISCCTHILGQRWLDESARVGASVSEQANCLLDEAAEAKWQFSLRRTMYGIPREQRMHLFSGHNVFITAHKSVQPPVKDLMKIVECAGGKASSKGKPGPNDLVITSEAAMGTAAVKKQLAVANPERIYSTELILSSILQQEIALDKNRLERPMTDTNKRRI